VIDRQASRKRVTFCLAVSKSARELSYCRLRILDWRADLNPASASLEIAGFRDVKISRGQIDSIASNEKRLRLYDVSVSMRGVAGVNRTMMGNTDYSMRIVRIIVRILQHRQG
jgi:hypothetical protein